MNIETIKQIQAMYQELGSHERVKQAFGLNDAQEYAINIFGRDNQLSAAFLAEKMDSIRDGMTIGEISVALGFPAEAAIRN